MKRIHKNSKAILFAFVLTFFLPTEGVLAQGTDPEQVVYFFNISVYKQTHRLYGTEMYKIRGHGGRPYNTKLKNYERKLWKNLSRGSALLVGPFWDYHEAERASKFYVGDSIDLKKIYASDPVFQKHKDENKQVYWFQLKVQIRPRSHSYDIERIPARVMSGSYETFKQIFETGISLGNNITIGPFMQLDEAEEAKRNYRLQD